METLEKTLEEVIPRKGEVGLYLATEEPIYGGLLKVESTKPN